MSTRRRLGMGPGTTRSTLSTDTAPRLMPVERAEPDALPGTVEQHNVVDRRGRRNLGPGGTSTPEGMS